MGNIAKTKANVVEIFTVNVSVTGVYAKFIPKTPVTGIIIRKISGTDFTTALFVTEDSTGDLSITNYIPLQYTLAVDFPYIKNTRFPVYGVLFVVSAPAVYQVEYSY